MSPLGDAVCYVSGLGLWSLSTMLLCRTHPLEISKRASWGWITGALALLACIAPASDASSDITAILALIVCSAGWSAFAWGRSPSAPLCVQSVTGWDDLITVQRDDDDPDTRRPWSPTEPWRGS